MFRELIFGEAGTAMVEAALTYGVVSVSLIYVMSKMAGVVQDMLSSAVGQFQSIFPTCF